MSAGMESVGGASVGGASAGAARRRRALTVAAAGGVAALALSVAACGRSGAAVGMAQTPGVGSAGTSSGGTSGGAAVAGAGTSSGPQLGSSAGPKPGGDLRPADPFSAAVAGYLAQRSGTVLADVYDVRTGQSWRLGDGPVQDEASVVKLDILEALLNARDGTGLSSDDRRLASQMIENSDNDAATSLWYAAGGTAGLAAYDDKAGLTGTTPSECVSCHGFRWPGWGLTTTVPADQITLLKQLIMPGSLLTAGDRQYALSLLENVTPGQAWGISGGVPAGVTVALKNGWLPLNDKKTDWQVNSEGWVSGDGRDYLICVLSTGNPSEQYGIDTIDDLSTAVWTALG